MTRPQTLKGTTHRIKTGCGYLYITDNTDSDCAEIILRLGKPGCCPRAFLQAIAMTASVALRYGMPKEKLISQWKGIQCPSPMWSEGRQVLSCPDAVAQVLELTMKEDKVG